MDLETLRPALVWSIFGEICAIPHASHDEAALGRWVDARARSKGLESSIDPAGNVLVRVPASPGLEKAPGLVLQAHLDMVAQADSGTPHDFARDPIRPRPCASEEGWIEASGTTLGADNGIGVAAAIALMESPEARHGPLECLFTVTEEDGMVGARALAAGALRGRYLLNLDSEEEGEVCIGCAGSIRLRAEAVREAPPVPADFAWIEASIRGLLGGHSGMDIQLGRGNAARLMAALLVQAGRGLGWRLASLESGSAANAIPREARALVALPPASAGAWLENFGLAYAAARRSLDKADPGFLAEAAPVAAGAAPRGARALEGASSVSLLEAVLAMPDGLLAMSGEIEGLPQTSCNLGILRLGAVEDGLRLELLDLVRSATEEDKEEVAARAEAALAAAGVAVARPVVARAWPPDPADPLVAIAASAYKDLFGKEARVTASHGGLECGLFKTDYPGMSLVSVGPNIRFPHSPQERVEIASVERFWRYLLALAERLATG